MAISFKKYGWERCPEDDFSDDGNRFLVYRHPDMPEMRLTKLNANRDGDGFYIDFYFDNNRILSYDELRSLKCAEYLDKLNCGCHPTQEEINDVCEHVIIAYKDYIEKCKEAKPVQHILVEDMWNMEKEAAEMAYNEAYTLVKDNFEKIISLENYKRNNIFDYLNNLKNACTRFPSLESKIKDCDTSRLYAISYVSHKIPEYSSNYYYRYIAETLA